MKTSPLHRIGRRSNAGFTLVEMLSVVGVGTILLVNIGLIYIGGLKSFVCMSNYQALDTTSCRTMDSLNKAIRGATSVMAYQANSYITFTNAVAGQGITVRYYPTSKCLVTSVTGQAAQTNLTGCDSWSFTMFTRSPNLTSTNVTFYTTTTASACKLVEMNWHCFRNVLGSALTTESIQTAQIVLRNKTN